MTEEIIIDGVNVVGWTDEEVYYKFEHHTSKTIKQIAFDLYKQLKRLQETLKHAENGRKAKANKLKRIEEIVTHCIQGGFTDEFVQEIFDICREYEEV